MARRMMSDKVIKTDSFMEMPHSTKNLYFYLMIEADDDGFVSNPKTIMKMVSAAEDDYKILIGKRFIIPFESGICVIKHWLVHNLIRADRKIDTQWAGEKKLLIVDSNTRKYSLDKGLSPDDNQVTTNGTHRLGKVRLGKGSIGKTVREVSAKKKYGEFKNVLLSVDEYNKLVDALSEGVTDNLIAELGDYLESTNKRYKSHYATLKSWARRKIQEHHTKANSKGKNIVGL